MANAFTSELDAVNTILSIIDEEPVNSITGDNLPLEVTNAINTLQEINREIQQVGWHWNTEYEFPLTPQSDGSITLPQSTLEFDVNPRISGNPVDKEYIQRGVRVYNRTDRTYDIGRELKATIVSFLNWDDMPEPFRRWVMIRAGRTYSNRAIGDRVIDSFTRADENMAKAAAVNYEARTKNATIFDSAVAGSILRRGIHSGRAGIEYGNY